MKRSSLSKDSPADGDGLTTNASTSFSSFRSSSSDAASTSEPLSPDVKRRKLASDDGPANSSSSSSSSSRVSTSTQYLDTINRKVLDFDFEKLCSISLSNMNVYACLICGRYFQGRGKHSHAYFHSLELDHHVFINLETERIYCLPEGYEVKDSSLEDIQYNLHPVFKVQDLPSLDNNRAYTHALDGTDYLPGLVGLNNIKNTDWLNCVVQALVRIPSLRDFFIIESNWKAYRARPLVQRFGELVAKMWNPRSFKGHVSPHELLQAIATESNKRFRIGVQSDPLQFLSWFLTTLHKDLGGSRHRTSIIHSTFQGEVIIDSETPILSKAAARKVVGSAVDQFGKLIKAQQDSNGGMDEDGNDQPNLTDSYMVVEDAKESGKQIRGWRKQRTPTPFLYLSLTLPNVPLFKETQDRTMIPQVHLFELLRKFNGEAEEIASDGTKKRFLISRLPRYLIIHVRRFSDNNWFVEKNITLVNFPLKGLDMRPYLAPLPQPSAEELRGKNVAELKKFSLRFR